VSGRIGKHEVTPGGAIGFRVTTFVAAGVLSALLHNGPARAQDEAAALAGPASRVGAILEQIKARYPGLPIVTYVNSTAAVKAESTVCCTSANSIKVVESFTTAETVYMAPDQNLAKYTARHTNKQVHYWNGYCPIHHNLLPEHVRAARSKHPRALFLAHPECRPEVLDLADVVSSTSGMLRYVAESPQQEFIIGTESGILYPMNKQNPGKRLYPASDQLICPNMKRISVADVCNSLETLAPRVTVPEDIRLRALDAVNRMLAVV
jgi:quinolinate synthase